MVSAHQDKNEKPSRI